MRNANVSASESDGHTLLGYPIVWNQETEIYDPEVGTFYEKVSPDAIDESQLVDVVLNVNHDDNQTVARTKNDTLFLEKDDYGLAMRAKIGDAQFQIDTYEKVKQGLLSQMSFNAIVRYEDSVGDDGRLIKTIVEVVRLRDVSLVTRPAYDGTSVIARNKEENMEDNKLQNSESTENTTENIDENVVDETVKDVEQDVKENADENKIDEDKLMEKVVDKIDKLIEDKLKTKEGDNMENKDLQNTERSASLDIEKHNSMEKASADVKRASDEYLAIWARGVRNDDMSEAKRFLASTKIGDNSDGSALVPTKLEDTLITELRNGGHIANLCSKTQIRGIVELAYEKSATDANWHEEGAEALPEEKVEYGQILLKPKYIKKWIAITDYMEDMTDLELGNYIIEEIANKVLEFLDDSIIAGDGTNGGVKGITKNTDEMFVAHVDDITTETLVSSGKKALARLRNVRKPVMVVSQQFYYDILESLTNTNGELMSSSTTIEGVLKPMWNGIPVEFSTSPALAVDKSDTTKPFAIVGDFSAYRLNCPKGFNVEVLRDPYTKSPENIIRYVGKLNVAGDVIRPHSFVTLKMGA